MHWLHPALYIGMHRLYHALYIGMHPLHWMHWMHYLYHMHWMHPALYIGLYCVVHHRMYGSLYSLHRMCHKDLGMIFREQPWRSGDEQDV